MLRVNALSGFGGASPTAPIIQGRTTDTDSSTTSHTIGLPGTAVEGDILIVFIAVDTASNAFTWPGSWVELDEQDNSSVDMAVGYLVAAGGETSVDVTTSASCNSCATAYRVSGVFGVPVISSPATGNDDSPDPASLAPVWGASKITLWLVGAAHQSGTAFSAVPSNYSNGQLEENNRSIASAERTARLASENPGTFTAAASGTWVAFTVAMRGR